MIGGIGGVFKRGVIEKGVVVMVEVVVGEKRVETKEWREGMVDGWMGKRKIMEWNDGEGLIASE